MTSGSSHAPPPPYDPDPRLITYIEGQRPPGRHRNEETPVSIDRYRKSIAALVGALATWGLAAAADGEYTHAEWWGLLAALATVVAVWGSENATTPSEPGDDSGAVNGSIVVTLAAVLVGIAALIYIVQNVGLR